MTLSREPAEFERRLTMLLPDRRVASVARTAGTPFLLAALAIANFLPVELSLSFAGLRLSPARLLLLPAMPYLVFRLVQKAVDGRYRFAASDAFMLLAGAWMLMAATIAIGLDAALNHAGPEILDFCGSYLAVRVLLTKPGQAQGLTRVLCLVIAMVGLLATLDSLIDRFVVHDLVNALTGYGDVVGRPDYRLGMRRAAGTVEHPILLGTACMVGLLCTGAVGKLFRPLYRASVLVGCAAGLVFSVSSAPLQAAIMAFCLLTYKRMFPRFRQRWLLLFALLGLSIGFMFALLGSPLGFINEHLVFDAESGYSREYEWETVGVYVLASPWIGIGFGWDVIAERIGAFASIDSIWLGKALIYGIPCSVFISLSLVGAGSLPTSGRQAFLTTVDAQLGTVLAIVLLVLIFIGFTVYFWGSLWVLSAMLSGMRAHLGELARLDATNRDAGNRWS